MRTGPSGDPRELCSRGKFLFYSLKYLHFNEPEGEAFWQCSTAFREPSSRQLGDVCHVTAVQLDVAPVHGNAKNSCGVGMADRRYQSLREEVHFRELHGSWIFLQHLEAECVQQERRTSGISGVKRRYVLRGREYRLFHSLSSLLACET